MLMASVTWVLVYGVFSLVMGLSARCKTRKGIDITGFQIIYKMDGEEEMMQQKSRSLDSKEPSNGPPDAERELEAMPIGGNANGAKNGNVAALNGATNGTTNGDHDDVKSTGTEYRYMYMMHSDWI